MQTTTNNLSELREEYTKVTGKKNGHFLSEAKLLDAIREEENKEEDIDLTKFSKSPVFLKGEPYFIINDKYYKENEALLLIQRAIVKREQKKLEQMQKGIF